jgi:hypothetical protein
VTSPGSEHISRYRALGEFDSLIRSAREARRALQELRAEEAKLNAQSLAEDKAVTASKQARSKAEKDNVEAAKKATNDLNRGDPAGKAGESAGTSYTRGMGKGIEKQSQSPENKRFVEAATNALRDAFGKAGNDSGVSFQGAFGKTLKGGSGSSSFDATFKQTLKDMRDTAGPAGQDTGNRYVQGFASKIRDLNNILHVIGFDKLDLDVSVDDAKQSIKAIEFELTKLSHETANPQVRIDTNRALVQLRAVQKLFKDEVADEIVKDSQRIQEELKKVDALPSGKSFKFWALTALSDMSRVFEEADRGVGVFTKLRQAAAGGGGGGNFIKSFISGFDEFSESSSNLLQNLGKVSGQLYRMPGLIGVIVTAIPALVSGIGALGGGALGLASGLGASLGLVAAAPPLFAALAGSIGGVSGAFGGMAQALKDAKTAQQQEDQAKEQARIGTEKTLTAQQKLNLELNNLSPATEKVTAAFIKFSLGYADVQQAVGEDFFKQVVNDTGRLNQLLPIATNFFGASATAIGKLADEGLRMITSGPWKQDFRTIAKENAVVIDNIGHAGLSLANIFRDVAVAAGPFTTWLTKGLREGAKAFSDWASEARSDGTITRFLSQTQNSLESLWGILKNLGSVVNSFFQSTVDEGQRYLVTLEDITSHWADVAKAQEATNSPLRTWMTNIRPVLSALGGLIGDLARGIAGLASNQNNISTMIALLNSLRTQVLPPILDILQKLNDSGIAATVTHALGEMLSAIASFLDSGAANALTVFVTVLAKFAEILFNIASLPGVSQVLGGVASGLAALAAVSVVARFTGLFKIWDFFTWMLRNKGNLSGAFSDAARGVAGLPSNNQAAVPKNVPSSISIGPIGSEVLSDQAKQIDNAGEAASRASGKVGVFSRAMSGISTAGSSAKSALSGFVGFLGGPWGIALTAATIGITLLANHLSDQKKEAEDTKNAFLALKGAYSDLKEGNTDNLKNLADTDDKLKDVIDSASHYGLSLTDVSGALNDQQQSLSRFNAQMDTQIGSLKSARDEQIAYAQSQGDTTGAFNDGIQAIQKQIDAAESYRKQVNNVAGAQDHQNQILADAAAMSRTYQERLAGMTDAQVQASVASGDLNSRIETLSHALDTMSSASATSSDRSKALSDIINSQYGATINANEATESWSSTLLEFADTIKSSRSELGKHEDALGTNSRAGLRNRDALEQAAKSARDLYLQDIASGVPMDQATAKHDARIKALQKEADKAKLNKSETRKLIDTYGDVPDHVDTDLKLNNYSKVYDQMQKLKMFQASLQSGKSITDAQKEVDQSIARANAHNYNYATGGRVIGSGSKTSDSIQAWLSNGEFVQPTDSVEYYGLPLMEAIRNRKLDRSVVGDLLNDNGEIEAYANGGHAHAASCPSCASGGHKLNFATGGSVTWPFPVDVGKTLIKKSWGDSLGAVPGGGQFTPGYQNQLAILRRAGFNFHPSTHQTYAGGHAPNSWHYRGRAVDLAPPNDAAWNFLVKNYAKTSKELFWASKAVNYRHGQATGPHDKTNHIHWAYNQGGLVDLMDQLGMNQLAPQQQNTLPSTPRTLSPAASSVVNNSTENTRTFGDVIINNPMPERSGDSIRDALYRAQLLY